MCVCVCVCVCACVCEREWVFVCSCVCVCVCVVPMLALGGCTRSSARSVRRDAGLCRKSPLLVPPAQIAPVNLPGHIAPIDQPGDIAPASLPGHIAPASPSPLTLRERPRSVSEVDTEAEKRVVYLRSRASD